MMIEHGGREYVYEGDCNSLYSSTDSSFQLLVVSEASRHEA